MLVRMCGTVGNFRSYIINKISNATTVIIKRKPLLFTIPIVVSSAFVVAISRPTSFYVAKSSSNMEQIAVNEYQAPLNEYISSEKTRIDMINSLNYEYKSANKAVYINSNAVNILCEPDDEADPLFAVGYADKLFVMGEDVAQSNGWTKVNYNHLTGYIPTIYLSDTPLFISDERYIYISEQTELRSSPEERDDNAIALINQNVRVKQIGINPDWIKIMFDNDIFYISSEYYSLDMVFVEEERTIYANSDVALKSSPIDDIQYNAITIPQNTQLKQLGYNSSWVKVEYDNDIYYIEKNNTSNYAISKSLSTYTITFNDSSVSGQAALVIEKAYSMLGTRYSYGSASLYETDCSGLTMQCFATAGIQLPHSSREQSWYGVDAIDTPLQPGDLICFSSKYGTVISHVGIYVGNGEMIHAATYGTGVVLTSLDNYVEYGGTIQAVRRFF